MAPEQLVSIIGFLVLPLIAFLFSLPYWREVLDARSEVIKKKRKSSGPLQEAPVMSRMLWVFPGRVVILGMLLQVGLAFLLLKTSAGVSFFDDVRDFFAQLKAFTDAGTTMVFGPILGSEEASEAFFGKDRGTIVAIHALMTIVFVGSLTAILYQLGIMQLIVRFFAWIMRRTLGTSGPESLGAAANIFVGPGEAAFTIKPYLPRLTQSELFALVTCGLATVAGNVLIVYASFGADAGHLLSASIISAPAALLIAKLMVPETHKLTSDRLVDPVAVKPKIDGAAAHSGKQKKVEKKEKDGEGMAKAPYANIFDAAAQGAMDGIRLVMIIIGILIAFLALIALVDAILMGVGSWFGWKDLSLGLILGYIFLPFAWLIGIPTQDCELAAQLLGKKTVLNEFLAYLDLTKNPTYTEALTPRSKVLLTYALCGFANFSTIGISIGMIGGLAPERKADVAKIGLRAMIGGTLAALMTACVAGFLLSDADIDAANRRNQLRLQQQQQSAPVDQPQTNEGTPGS